jgi:hypothetical protein
MDMIDSVLAILKEAEGAIQDTPKCTSSFNKCFALFTFKIKFHMLLTNRLKMMLAKRNNDA